MHPTTDPPNAYPKLDEAVRAHMKRELLATIPTDQDVWIYGYGSLMWNPGFEHAEAKAAFPARLETILLRLFPSLSGNTGRSRPCSWPGPGRGMPWHGLPRDTGTIRRGHGLSVGAGNGDRGL